MKQFKFGKEARDALFAGVTILSRSVTTTLGPKGRNVALDRKWDAPTVLHDGVSVAKDIELPDAFENMGAQLVKEAASKTNDRAGDGTTTSTLLAFAITENGIKEIDNPEHNANPMSLKKGIDMAVEVVVEELKKISQPVDSYERVAQIATISSANPEIGRKIATAMDKVGRDGVITVDSSSGMDIEIEYTEGMEFDGGVVSPLFYSDTEKGFAEIQSPFILLTDQRIENPMDLVKIMEKVVKEANSKELVILADSFSDGVIATFAINQDRGTFTAIPTKAPGFADRRKQYLEDIAILTGGTVITRELGVKFEDLEVSHLGRCEKIWADKDKTQIVGGLGDKPALSSRVTQLKNEIEKEKNDFEKKKLQERLAKLAGGAAIIKVGAQTETELKEVKERVIDAVEATKSAVAEGYVVGGGLALKNSRDKLFALTQKLKANPEFESEVKQDIEVGIMCVYNSLGEPFAKIVSNAGYKPDAVETKIYTKSEEGDTTVGLDVETGKIVDLIEKGIIDPTKVVRSALQNAGSVASMILTTDVLVANLPEKLPNNV